MKNNQPLQRSTIRFKKVKKSIVQPSNTLHRFRAFADTSEPSRLGYVPIAGISLVLIACFAVGHLLMENKQLTTQLRTLYQEKSDLEEGQNELATLSTELSLQLEDIRAEREALTKEYQLRIDAQQHQLAHIEEQRKQELAQLRAEQHNQLQETMDRLNKRSQTIKAIMDQIGIKVTIQEDPKHSGGLFSPLSSSQEYVSEETVEAYGKKLLAATDIYLDILQTIPLGAPIKDTITSRYGRRSDPFNRKRAFHTGVDFNGKTGDAIRAPANGRVKTSAYSKSWGHYIVLEHGYGYETLFAHLSRRMVKKNAKIKRGQIIGKVGSTGRSTGSHLHYEVHHKGRHINPLKFIRAQKLAMTFTR